MTLRPAPSGATRRADPRPVLERPVDHMHALDDVESGVGRSKTHLLSEVTNRRDRLFQRRLRQHIVGVVPVHLTLHKGSPCAGGAGRWSRCRPPCAAPPPSSAWPPACSWFS